MPSKLFQVSIPPWARDAFGGRRNVTRRFSDEANGELWVSQQKTKIQSVKVRGEAESLGEGPKTSTFRLIAGLWLDQLEVRPSTYETYRVHLKAQLIPAFGDLRLSAIRDTALIEYRVRRKRAGAGARSIQAEMQVFQRVIRWAQRRRYVVDSRLLDVELPKATPRKSERRIYDPESVERLLAVASRRDAVVIEVLSRTGLRVGELRAFDVGWLRWSERRLVVPHDLQYSPKGGRTRSIPLESELVTILRDWVGDRTAGRVFEPLTPGRRRKGHYRGTGLDVQRLMDRLSAAAGLELTAHDLRHHAISRWVALMPDGRYSLADVQEWAGHASIRTTELYLHTSGGRWRSHADALDLASSKQESKHPVRKALRILRR
jgi:integrase